MSDGRLPWYTILTGAIILTGFTWLAYFMISIGSTLGQQDQYRWDRLLLIFNAVQTLTVAAAGALLGSSVQQARVASAEARADAADASAKTTQAQAAKAEAARRLVENLDPPGTADRSPEIRLMLGQLRAVLV